MSKPNVLPAHAVVVAIRLTLALGCLTSVGQPQNLLADDASGFSFGGRTIDAKRRWVAEPYSPAVQPTVEDAPQPPPTAPLKPTLLEPPAIEAATEPAAAATTPPSATTESPMEDSPDSPKTTQRTRRDTSAHPATTPSSAPLATRAVAVAEQEKRPQVVPTSGIEPGLISQAASPPLVVYQPMTLPNANPTPQAGSTETSLVNSLALLAAGFAAGVSLVLAMVLLPVAIAVRRNLSWLSERSTEPAPRHELSPAVTSHTPAARSRGNVAPPPAEPSSTATPKSSLRESLNQQASRDAAEDQTPAQRHAAALFAHVLEENLALQDQLRRPDSSE